jgi:hypothetical protein
MYHHAWLVGRDRILLFIQAGLTLQSSPIPASQVAGITDMYQHTCLHSSNVFEKSNLLEFGIIEDPQLVSIFRGITKSMG